MAQVTCPNGYDAFCDCGACEALEASLQRKAAAEHKLYAPKWDDQSEAYKAEDDPYYRFYLGLEETNEQRALRIQTDAELNELYRAEADAFFAALMDNESMVETGADDR